VTLQPGDTRTISVGAGVYDILAVDCNNNVIEETHDNNIDQDSKYTITG
jgi:hypothetical protein